MLKLLTQSQKESRAKNKGNKILEEHAMYEGDVKIYRVAQSGNVWQIYIGLEKKKKQLRNRYVLETLI
jgi:hypothetical protein